MKELTDNIKEQIRDGWKVGVERDNTMVVYDVITKDDNEIVGKERWILYPKDSGKPVEEVKKSLPKLTELSEAALQELKKTQTAFTAIALNDIVSCLSNADGNIYSHHNMMEKYGVYE